MNAVVDLPLEVPEDLREIAYLEGGVLYVASHHYADTRVIELEMRLSRMGAFKRKQQVSAVEIKNRTGATAKSSGGVSRMEKGRELAAGLSLIETGVRMKASDLHFVFKGSVCLIKYRVDGYLDIYSEMAKDDAERIISAIYVHANVKNRGSFNFNGPIAARLDKDLPDGLYACRFASIKTESGGAVVLRLLYDTVANRTYGEKDRISLPVLGFDDAQVALLEDMAASPNGLIIIDGPTGSGKSTTLKYVLQWVHQHYPQFNILTVEDPPEYPIFGAQQIPVLVQDDDVDDPHRRTRAYSNIINTTLRLDPDILMVGEIRDGTSSIAALRAAITGHRLWTTLHANDAWEALNRLIDLLREGGMQDPMPVLANTQNLTGLIAQRLVPTLCPHCRKPLVGNQDRVDPKALDELMKAGDVDLQRIFVRGDGCEHCVPNASDNANRQYDKRRGILGRTVVAEIVRPDQGLLDVAREHGIPRARHYWMEHRDGKLLADQAIAKIQQGLLDPGVAREFIGPLITAQQVLSLSRSTS